jgi:hypothetical protein
MGFARLAAPTGFGVTDIAPASAGNALQAGAGRRLAGPGRVFTLASVWQRVTAGLTPTSNSQFFR